MPGAPSGRHPTARSVVDYGLARRATLTGLVRGQVSRLDACDAHPYLLRAARYHGEPTDRRCPVCRGDRPLTLVTYTYGDELGPASGRACATKELSALAERFRSLTVYVVEVCQACSWNHLVTSYVIGRGNRGLPDAGPRARRVLPDPVARPGMVSGQERPMGKGSS